MSSRWLPPGQSSIASGLPRPGKALIACMVGMLAIWVMFAVGINWGGGGTDVFKLLVGDTRLILKGQLWRLFTAPFVHMPTGEGAVSHIITTLLGLYFLAPSLEKRWGGTRMVLFIYGSALAGFVTQIGVELLLPDSIAARVVQPQWFGAVSAVTAIAIAWALSFRGQTVALMFVLPVSSTVLVVFVVGLAVLRLLVGGVSPEGAFSPFGAMLFGWLVGGGDPPPIRRWLLNRRLRELQEKKASLARARAGAPKLRVIEGGGPSKPSGPAPDKRWLN